MLLRLFLAAFLALALNAPLRAAPYSQKQLETWVDAVMSEMRKAGAENASHGAVSYDASSGKFSVSDIKVTLSEKVWSFKPADEKKTDDEIKIEPLVLTIARISADGLMMDGSNWTAAKFHVEKLRLGAKNKKGALLVSAADYENITGPQVAANDLGTSPIEQIVGFLQQASMKSSTVSGVMMVADENNPKDSNFRLGDIRSSDVVKGKAKLTTMAESSALLKQEDFEDSGKDKEGNKIETSILKAGPLSIADFNYGLYADFFLKKPNHAGQKDQPLYSEATFEGGSLKSGSTFDFSIRKMKSANARINIPEKGLMSLIGPLNDKKLTEDEIKKIEADWMSSYGEWAKLVMTGTLEWDGFTFKSPDVQMEMKSVAGKEIGATIGELVLNKFSMTAPDLKASFETVNLKKIDTATFTDALYVEMAKNKDNPDFKNLEGKLPTFGLIEINNFSIQSEDEPPLQTTRVAFGLESWAKFLPQHFYFKVDNLVFPATAFATLEAPNLKDLGYEKLVLNSDTQFNYTESTKLAAFAPVKFDFSEAGNIAAELKFAEVDSSKLGDVLDIASQLSTARFEKLMLQLNNGNFLDRYVAWKAKADGKSEKSVREEMGLILKMAAIAIPDEAQKKKANDAIDAFVENPKNLTVTITPKGKLTLLDLQLGALANQMGLLNKVNFDVTANSGGL